MNHPQNHPQNIRISCGGKTLPIFVDLGSIIKLTFLRTRLFAGSVDWSFFSGFAAKQAAGDEHPDRTGQLFVRLDRLRSFGAVEVLVAGQCRSTAKSNTTKFANEIGGYERRVGCLIWSI